jgi:TRAP-type C4-dicarboxylate transport system substrate-binding protein
MGRKSTVGMIVVLIVCCLFAVSASWVQAQNVIHWKGQSCFASTVSPYGPFKQGQTGVGAHAWWWADWVKKSTNGRLVIDLVEPGAVFPIAESDTAVSKNVVQFAVTYPSYYGGRIPESDVETGGVFVWENEAQLFEAHHKYGLFEALQRIYAKHNLKWLPYHTDAIVGIGTTFPAPNPQSFKGKKIRAVGMWADFVRMLGASPVSLPWGEIYMGMKLGTIDGYVAGSGTLEELKLKEVTKGYVSSPMVSTAFANIIINMDAWKALPPDIQTFLERNTPYYTYAMSSNWHNQCTWVLKNAEQQYGLKIYAWSNEEIDRLTRQTVDEIYPRIAKKSKDCAELIEIVKKQMRDYGRIK